MMMGPVFFLEGTERRRNAILIHEILGCEFKCNMTAGVLPLAV